MRILGRLIWLIISVVMISIVVSFTVSNDLIITLALWPFPQTLDVPIWLAVIAGFIIGGMLGGGLMMGQALTIRAKLWRSQSQIQKLEARTVQRIEENLE